MELKQIQDKRKEKEKEIQNGYDSLTTYKEKLAYIYKILMISQEKYLEYKNNFTFTDKYLNELLSRINENMREGEFADFIEENIINKMDSGHVYLSATKQVVDKGKILKPIEKVKESLKNDNVEIIFQEDTAIIKIKSFSNKFINEDAYLYQNLKTYLSEYDINNIVIDIRGNNGGSDSYFRHFDIFTDKNLNIDDKVFDLFLNENTEITWTIIPAGTDKHYNKYLLVDEEVFSTAEKLTAACKQNGYATIIGAPTMGEGLI